MAQPFQKCEDLEQLKDEVKRELKNGASRLPRAIKALVNNLEKLADAKKLISTSSNLAEE